MEDLTTSQLAALIDDIVSELIARGAWRGARPHTRLVPVPETESELRAAWGDR